MKIFSHFDQSNLVVIAKVCQKFSDVVKMIHDTKWKSVTRAVLKKRDALRPLYEGKGWIEAEHGMDQCNCIKVAMELFMYDDPQLLNNDLEFLKSNSKLNVDKSYELNVLEQPEIAEIQAFSRLSAAGVLTHIREVEIMDIDFSNIKKIGQFISIVEKRLEFGTGSLEPDLSKILRFVNCKELVISWRWNRLTKAEMKSLHEVLNSKVEKFTYSCGYEPFLPCIKQYDGKGKCKEIELEYTLQDEDYDSDEDVDSLWGRDRITDWAESRGWTVTLDHFWPDYHRITIKRN